MESYFLIMGQTVLIVSRFLDYNDCKWNIKKFNSYTLGLSWILQLVADGCRYGMEFQRSKQPQMVSE